jgi:hypothetical protein
MRTVRFTIAGLMGAVLIAAVGLAALRNASPIWAGAMVLLTYVVLGLAILCVLLRGRTERAWWLGFCVFGWGYLGSWGVGYEVDAIKLPTTAMLEALGPWLGVPVLHSMGLDTTDRLNPWYEQVGQCLGTLLAAVVGGILARLLFAAPTARSESDETVPHPTCTLPRTWWPGLTIAALSALVLAVSVVTVRSMSAPGFRGGATFLLACGLLGLTGLGAIAGRDRRRTACLGATIFGAGYMLLVFASHPYPTLPTGSFLNQLRPWLPLIADGAGSANARIFQALERRIPMHFPDETSLGDLLEYIRKATATPTDHGIPIHVDLISLRERERDMGSTVTIDADGLPLKTTLRLCLRQLDLDFSVQDGYVLITSEDHVASDLEDPFLIVGHCLLALLAAGFGAVAAPFISSEDRIVPNG